MSDLDKNALAGNLLVLRDGRIGFIDFGIVGRISPATWAALTSLADSFQTKDYNLMARYNIDTYLPLKHLKPFLPLQSIRLGPKPCIRH